MKKIAILGVGSTYFTKGIVESLIKFGGSWDLRLVDIDDKCLDIAMKLSQRIVDHYEADVKISGSVDRLDILDDLDAVVSTIGVGGRRAWEKDVFMFHEFNIHQSTGDTYGAGGVSRALRTVPVLIEIARDMERLCPNALLVNFTNPMTVNCWALSKVTKIKTIGLCYGVTSLQHHLANLIGMPFSKTWTEAVGVNHFTWITDFHCDGKDAWPLVREAIAKNLEVRAGNPYTWELFDVFGAWPTVGDGHICEFIPGFQGKNMHYGKTFGTHFKDYAKHWDDVFREMEDQAYGHKPLTAIDDNTVSETFKDEDLFIDVLMAIIGDGPSVERTINLPNQGIVSGLPSDAVLEVTSLVNSSGIHPYAIGELPPGINAIIARIIASQALTVEASLHADRNLVIQALMADLTALTRDMAEKITDCIFKNHRAYLPQFFS